MKISIKNKEITETKINEIFIELFDKYNLSANFNLYEIDILKYYDNSTSLYQTIHKDKNTNKINAISFDMSEIENINDIPIIFEYLLSQIDIL